MVNEPIDDPAAEQRVARLLLQYGYDGILEIIAKVVREDDEHDDRFADACEWFRSNYYKIPGVTANADR